MNMNGYIVSQSLHQSLQYTWRQPVNYMAAFIVHLDTGAARYGLVPD